MPETEPILCYVTDRKALAAPASLEETERLLLRIRQAIAAGLNWVQIREKDSAARMLTALARQAVAATGRTRILVNDRLDVALASGAAGVHLGRESLPAERVKAWCREHVAPGFLVGISCHSLEEARQAEQDGADYLIFGPVFSTPSKLQYGSPLGLDRLAAACRAVRIPVMAIGGITLQNAAQCIRAGAAGLAAIRLFQEAWDLSALVAQLRANLQP